MILSIAHILTADEVRAMHTSIAALDFEAGQGGWAAAGTKRNLQARASIATDAVAEPIAACLLSNPVFELAARPKRIIGPLLSQYLPGAAYGAHVDDPILDGARADLAFTLFLSAPDSYEGGDLVLAGAAGEEAFKLPPGHLILYPATTLHFVAPVTRGARLVAVGWVRSLIRDAAQRELLFELDTARRALFERHGKTHEFDLLSKTVANLIRMWADD